MTDVKSDPRIVAKLSEISKALKANMPNDAPAVEQDLKVLSGPSNADAASKATADLIKRFGGTHASEPNLGNTIAEFAKTLRATATEQNIAEADGLGSKVTNLIVRNSLTR